MTRSMVAEPDFASLTHRVEALLGNARVVEIQRLVGGSSSFTYAVTLDHGPAGDVILKSAPAGVEPRNNRDVLRQASIQQLLHRDSRIPVPEVLGCDPGAPPEVPPFFLMSRVPGVAFEPQVDAPIDLVSDLQINQRAMVAAQYAGLLAHVPVDDLLAQGEPLITPSAELQRWQRVFAAVPDDLRHNADDVYGRLQAWVPSMSTPSLVHGDWRLGNMLFDRGALTAVLDWEMWFVGDARCDLAWLLMFLTPGHPHARASHGLLPDRSCVLAAYCDLAEDPVQDLAWFEALARYKHAAACAHVTKNLRRLARPDVEGAMIERSIPLLLNSADSYL